jgi:hypothetical protein
MSYEITVYAFYGVRVPDDTDWSRIDDPGQCLNNGDVGSFTVPVRDGQQSYLVLSWEKKDIGECVYHSGEVPNASKFERDRWNDDLRAVADRLGLPILQGPGWITVVGRA